MKKLLLLLVSLLPIALYSQSTMGDAILNNAQVKFNTNGVMFNEYVNLQPGYEVPYGTGINAIFASSLWIGGEDSAGNLHTSAMTYCLDNVNGFCEFYPGPLKTDGSASTTPVVALQYNRYWYISRTQVEIQQAYFDCLNDPNCNTETDFPNGYNIPSEITNWPAHGNTDEGYAAQLAPFIDYNNDGIYNPTEGDYPSFTGDAARYTISNDNGGPHLSSQGTPLGLEIHTMFYYYYSNDPALSATMFVHQDFINRSDTSYEHVYIGIWNDFDLGNPTDDFIATDVENGYVYVYNGDSFDDPSSAGPGYGDDLAIMGCKILAGPYLDPNGIDDLGMFDGSSNLEYGDYTKGWNDGIVDNERMGLSSSVHSENGSGPTGIPIAAQSFYNRLRSVWSNSVPVRFGGTGYNPACQSCAASKYVFPGVSDPLLFGTDGIDPGYPLSGGWTEENEAHEPGDRQINANCGPFTLNAGQTQSLDYVYVFARQSDSPGEDLHDILTDHVLTAAATPDSLPVSVVSSVRQIHPEQIGFGLYPNPAGGAVTITLSGNVQATFRIFNVLGAQVSSGVLQADETTIDTSDLEHGLYLVNITIGGRSATRKLVVE